MLKDPFKIYAEQDDIKDKDVSLYKKQSDVDDLLSGKIESDSLKLIVNKKTITLVILVILAAFTLLLGRLAYVQAIRGDYYRQLAEGNRIRIVGIPASRGIIYDRNYQPLTKNIPNFYLQIIPSDLPDQPEELDIIIQKLATIFEIDQSELTTFFDDLPEYSYQPKIFQEYIDSVTALKLEVQTASLPGVSLEMSAIREYIYSLSTSHALGYTGKMTDAEFEANEEEYLFSDYIGKTGLELQYESELKGTNGKKEIEVDSFGKEKKVIAQEDPIIGNNLITTLDLELQQKLSTELFKAVESSHATGGAAIAIDPRDGGILAIVSSGSFDVNKFVRGISSDEYSELIQDPKTPLFFKTISGEYPSGSTVKPIISAAALQEGIITPSTTVNSVGGIRIDKWFFPDWKSGGHGVTNVIKAISESVNTFFYTIGGGTEEFDGLGVAKISYYAKLFGLSEISGIDLPGESSGFLPTKEWKEEVKNERWYIGDTYHLAIGQGDLLVTPLQIANSTATIANGGTFYRPHLLKEFTDSDNNLVSQKEPEIIRDKFISSRNIETVRLGMREAVLSGSSQALGSLPVSSAAKTGTAQFSGGNHAWFTSFAPYENPEISITVLVEKGGGGDTTALPVARNTLSWYFSR